MHRLRTLVRSLSPLLLVLPLAVCGDSATEPEEQMTEEQFEAFIEVLVVLSELDVGGVGTSVEAALAAAPAPVPETFPVDASVACPEGGSVHVAGTVTVDDETGFLGVSATETHQGCRATAPSSGMLFELNGAPNLAVDAEIHVSETQVTFQASQNGAIQWQTGGSSGTCTIDLDIDILFTGDLEAEPEITVEGTVCGQTVDQLMP